MEGDKSFAAAVYRVVAGIPKGQTLTYKQVAALAGNPRACRAVGNILNRNRSPEVPCHRVIRSDGKIGGYAWGTAKKAAILKKEGVGRPLGSGQPVGSRPLGARQPEGPRPLGYILPPAFFNRPVLKVAPELLGKYLVRRIGRGQASKTIALPITEVEAYDGPHDKACHASKGRTARTAPMFGPGGRFYVYFCYGIHWMLNIVTGPKGYPAAILIRAAGGINGPAKLTKHLQISKSLNKKPADKASGLWFEDRGTNRSKDRIAKKDIKRSPRIGVDYAGPVWAKKPYRFTLST
jgi:DNA-3-methyladenine glycosylase